MNLVDMVWTVKLKYRIGQLSYDQFIGILGAFYIEARAQEVLRTEVSNG
ncbi:hypothetical protein [Pseudarthrobacter sp. fls2-241-R2A-168]|nr:hypothetical protein [Pseudarthrobacter sp. fls2-241-R2A-168]